MEQDNPLTEPKKKLTQGDYASTGMKLAGFGVVLFLLFFAIGRVTHINIIFPMAIGALAAVGGVAVMLMSGWLASEDDPPSKG